ncbi:MAG: NUDIX domain-containing protein [SAR202 cluster bacterium]|nr:NUDIX domain-containing protein [SAR202 cluster bacterium]
MTVTRHFTATGYMVHNGRVALHWHKKVKTWLPAGGHIEENEDPVQAVRREIHEETGIEAEVLPYSPQFKISYPTQVTAPFTIMVEDIHDPVRGFHQHIDLIYVCRPLGEPGPLAPGWQWITKEQLTSGAELLREDGVRIAPTEEIRVIAPYAIELAERLAGVQGWGGGFDKNSNI